ncbi:hypothetical protein Q5752_002705 [Cryptotrichosporon argae]
MSAEKQLYAGETELKPGLGSEHIETAGTPGVDDKTSKSEAMQQENLEHSMTMWQAAKAYPSACGWAVIMCFTIVMESFAMFLVGNFVALPAFQLKYGTYDAATDAYVIPTKWQSALSQSGQIGALIGVCICPMITGRLGYRWTTIIGLMLMNATIFISFFGDSLPVFLIGQLFEGIPWGFFIGNAPAYASEIVPIPLRGACTATLQMAWAIGSIIVGGATYGLNKRLDEWAYRIPFALQWIFPTPLAILIFLAPESPWWLVRRGRKDEARRSIQRLGRSSLLNADDALAMMVRTVELEVATNDSPSYLDLFRGTDLRRTLITCFIYASQNFAGNLIANQAVYFFEQAGMSTNMAFALGLITSSLQAVAVACSWFLSSWFGRRTLFLWGLAVNIVMLFGLGIAASVSSSSAAIYAQAVLGLLISVQFCLTQGPISYAIIGETSSIRLRALTTGIGRGAYYVTEIPMIYLSSRMLNSTGWNLAGKCGFVWGGTAVVCWIIAYFYLPEFRKRSYRELDILFHRKVSARKFSKTEIDVLDDE